MSAASRGRIWFERFARGARLVGGLPLTVLAADLDAGGMAVRIIAVVPDLQHRFERARHGELGIDEGFAIAGAVRGAPPGSAILALVDVPGQAFGIREEAIGLQRALAAAADAYARARQGGRPVAALIVGKAISGAFLAHGIQAGWIGALRDPGVEVHVMSAPAAARVTKMSQEQIAQLAQEIPATSREVERFAGFGAIDRLFDVVDPSSPTDAEFAAVADAVFEALRDGTLGLRAPRERLDAPQAVHTRALARLVRERIDAQWDA
jgi:malonate decarboxylase gamma subunit